MSDRICVILFAFFLLTGCGEEDKPAPVKTEPRRKSLMSHNTELSAAPSDKIIFKIKNAGIPAVKLNGISEKHFGINSITVEGKKLIVLFNPSLISRDSIRLILVKDSVLIN